MIPTTLDQAVDLILAQMTEEEKADYRLEPEDHPGARFHHFGGMAMRNDWRLWEKTGPLNEWFRSHGVWHGDDKSGLIFKALWCRLNGRELDIAAEAAHYAQFWRETAGLDFDGMQISGIDPPKQLGVLVRLSKAGRAIIERLGGNGSLGA